MEVEDNDEVSLELKIEIEEENVMQPDHEQIEVQPEELDGMTCIVAYLFTHKAMKCNASYLGAPEGHMQFKDLDPVMRDNIRRRLPMNLNSKDMPTWTVPICHHHAKEFGTITENRKGRFIPCPGYAGVKHANRNKSRPLGVMAYLNAFTGNTFGILPGTSMCSKCVQAVRDYKPAPPSKRKRKVSDADYEPELPRFTNFNNVLKAAGIEPMEAGKLNRAQLKIRAAKKIEDLVKFCVDSLSKSDDVALEYETVRNLTPEFRKMQSSLEDVMSSLKEKYHAVTHHKEKIEVLMHAPKNWTQAKIVDYFSKPDVRCPISQVHAAEKRRDKNKNSESEVMHPGPRLQDNSDPNADLEEAADP